MKSTRARALWLILAVIVVVAVVVNALYFFTILAPSWAINYSKGTSFFTIVKDFADLILLIVEICAIAIAILVVTILLPRRYRRHRFVFGGFSGTSQLATALQRPINFDKLAAEELVKQARFVYSQVEEYTQSPTTSASRSSKAPSNKKKQNELDTYVTYLEDSIYYKEDLSRDNGVQPLQIGSAKGGLNEKLVGTILASLKDMFKTSIPDLQNLIKDIVDSASQEIAPIMKIINALLPPRIIKIAGYLQWQSDIPARVGLTFEATDLSEQRTLMLYTFWQPPKPAQADPQGTNAGVSSIMERYIALLYPIMRWLVLMLWGLQATSDIMQRHHQLNSNPKKELALLYYFLGAMYDVSSEDEDCQEWEPFFEEFAIKHLRLATDTDPSLWFPPLYLANIYRSKLEKLSRDHDEQLNVEERSLIYFKAQYWYDKAIGCLTDTIKGLIDTKNRFIWARIKIAKALRDARIIHYPEELVRDTRYPRTTCPDVAIAETGFPGRPWPAWSV